MALGRGPFRRPIFPTRARNTALNPALIRLFIQEYFESCGGGPYHSLRSNRAVDTDPCTGASAQCILFQPRGLFPTSNSDIASRTIMSNGALIFNMVTALSGAWGRHSAIGKWLTNGHRRSRGHALTVSSRDSYVLTTGIQSPRYLAR